MKQKIKRNQKKPLRLKILLGKTIKIISQASDEGRLYGAITNTIIAEKINNNLDLKEKITKNNVSIKDPIKETGVYEVDLALHYDIKSKIEVVVGKTKEHIDTILKEKKEGSQDKTKEKEAW